MMHEARKGDFLTRAWPSTVRTPRLNEKEFLADVLRPFHDALVKALAPHFHEEALRLLMKDGFLLRMEQKRQMAEARDREDRQHRRLAALLGHKGR
jgi:hypothetical protein